MLWAKSDKNKKETRKMTQKSNYRSKNLKDLKKQKNRKS